MCKSVLLITVLMVGINLPSIGQNQSPEIGLKGGLNVSNFYVDEVGDKNPRYGIHLGLRAKMPVTDFLAIQPEFLYSTRGANYDYSILGYDWETQLNMSYLDIPVMGVIDLSNYVSVQGGVYGSSLMGVNATTEGDTGGGYEELEKDNFQNFDYGLAAGIGFNISPITLELRYNYGLQGIGKEGWAEEVLGNPKNSALQLSAGFAF
ncbi:MAG: porin family protein [Bacteroidota bacterium]